MMRISSKNAPKLTLVSAPATDDVAGVVQHRGVEKNAAGIEVIYVIRNNTPVTLAICLRIDLDSFPR